MSAAVLLEEAVLDDLDFSIPCAYPEGCEREATHAMRCRECGASWLSCAFHVEETTQAYDSASPRMLAVCSGCAAFVPARRWRDLILVVPLGGS